ncbi:hypothetical protein DMH27_04060 [Raoultella planticola]|nr:hypothetical protein [Raoultella planticola]
MILIQLLAAGERTPGDQFMDIGVAGIVGDMFAFRAGPGRAGDDFTRLGLNIAKANLLIFFVDGQMGVIAPGKLSSACQALTATWPLVSGAGLRITSVASMALSMRGRPLPGRRA